VSTARKTGLGRGLDALIPGGDTTPGNGVTYLRLDQIVPNPYQPRAAMDPQQLDELAASIREHGVIQPLIVTTTPQSNIYQIIAGERRWQASRIAGLDSVPVVVRAASEQQQLELALIENVQRTDLSPLEAAEAYRQLTAEFNLTHEEIAARVGKSRSTVTNTMRLLDLPEAVRQALAAGSITEGHARALLALQTPQAQLAALQTIVVNGLNVRQTEELVRKLSGERPPRKAKPDQAPEIKAIEERLRDHLGTRVNLNHGAKGGSLVIHYYSDEELDTLIDRILGG
jgi:ParB family chromosome partitioning protein